MSNGRKLLKAMRLDEQPTIIVSYLYGLLDAGLFHQRVVLSYALVGAGLLLTSVASFVLNEFADQVTDNESLDREASHLTGAATIYLFLLFSVPGLLLGYLGNSPLCAMVVLISGLLYSLPKVYLKAKCGFDLLCLGLCFVIGPYCAPYEILAHRLQKITPTTFHALNILTLLLFLAACNLIAMIRDVDADRRAGIRNTTVRLGLENSLRLGIVLTLAVSALGTLVASELIFPWYIPILLCTPILACIFGFGLGAKADSDRVRRYFLAKARAGIATGNVLAAVLLLVALLGWWYTVP